MTNIQEIIQGEYVIASLYQNIWGEFILVLGTQILRYTDLAHAKEVMADYGNLEMKQAA